MLKSKVLNALEASVLGDGDHREIKSLNASNGGFHQIDDLSDCVELIKINLSKNLLEEISGVKHNENLQVLDVSRNSIEQLAEDQFTKLTNVRFINLSHNKLGTIPPLPRLKSLHTLLLNHNKLSALPRLSGMSSLRTLVASHNELCDVSKTKWAGLSTLVKLSLSHNKLTFIPEGISFLHDLEELRLNTNRLKCLPDRMRCNGSLKVLDLGNNSIKSFEDIRMLSELPGLCNLNLKGNPICDHPDYQKKIRDLYPNLQILDSRPLTKKRKTASSSQETKTNMKSDLATSPKKTEPSTSKEKVLDFEDFMKESRSNESKKSGVTKVEIVRKVKQMDATMIEQVLLDNAQRHAVGVVGTSNAWEDMSDQEKDPTTVQTFDQNNVDETIHELVQEPKTVQAPSTSVEKSAKPLKKRRRQKKSKQ